MAKKKGEPFVPDGLPEYARSHWPDITRWPAEIDVRTFLTATRRDPDVRLAVLTGLRRTTAIDLSSFWGWLAAYVSVIVALVSATTALVASDVGGWWIRFAIGALVGVLGLVMIVMLVRLATFTAQVDERRRGAMVWLRAFEEGIATGRRRR